MTNLYRLIISVFLLIYSLFAYAEGTNKTQIELHSHQKISQSAKQFLLNKIDQSEYSRINIKMKHLDSRLRLTQCTSPLVPSLAPGSRLSGKTTIHLQCNSQQPWTVYVGAQISLYNHVYQTATPLDKNHIINKSDLILIEKDLSRIKYGYFTNIDHLIGKQLKRRLPQNKIIKVNYVKSPTLVKRGEIVSIVAENSGYSVKMSGTALTDGVYGERIRVKNISSKRIIEGTVKKAGIISIN